jgi:hypothetical protein
MKRYNICTAKTYKKDGEDKKAWRTVGQLIEWEATKDKPHSFSIELYMQPDVRFSVFEEREREGVSSRGDGEDF